MPKSKIKVICFVLLYNFLILLTKKLSSSEMIIINPVIEMPSDFNDNDTMIIVKESLSNIPQNISIY